MLATFYVMKKEGKNMISGAGLELLYHMNSGLN